MFVHYLHRLKREQELPLGLEFPILGSCIWVLGPEPRSSGRVSRALSTEALHLIF